MPYREFTDERGVRWEVWEVHPTLTERRHAADPAWEESTERRKIDEGRPSLAPGLRDGWLAFQSASERRRLVPIDDDIETSTLEQLRELLQRADVLTPKRRLIE
ncbi:MAG: hypothetical protein H0W68_00470 [Gemmatimonadaceae bacterium]|nr:hypothetical protein [Gemmatimonadaceae bacterium]